MKTTQDKFNYAIEKKISESKKFLEILPKVIKGAEKIKHHSTINKRIEKAIKCQCHLDIDYSTKLKIYIKDRIFYQNDIPNGYHCADYHDSTDLVIYFKNYNELIEQAKIIIEAKKDYIKQLKKEKVKFGTLLKKHNKMLELKKDFGKNSDITVNFFKSIY